MTARWGSLPFRRQTPHTHHFPWAVNYCDPPLYSTDLNRSSEPIDIGRDPSFSFYLCPADILRINSVLAPLFHRLGPGGKPNKQKTKAVNTCSYSVQHRWKQTVSYHEASVADVPCECGHGPFLRVHNGILNDVCWAGHVLWKVALHPAWRSASFGQQTSGNEAVGRSNLSENDVLSQNMVTGRMEEKQWIKTIKENAQSCN